jgi:DNA polymerase III epsilon subunit-like protein
MNDLIGKKVFVFDLETTGLPQKKRINGQEVYDDYKINKSYDSSRIVSIAWYCDDNFDNKKINYDNIKEFIRKPIDFDNIPTTHIHGISYEHALQEGVDLKDILYNKDLHNNIINSDIIIGHNCLFDINILLNELYRNSFMDTFNHVEQLLLNKHYFCTAETGREICKIMNMHTYKYKMPKLSELYYYYFTENPKNSHNASDDVLSTLKILSRM